MKPKLDVCPKISVESQMRIKREWILWSEVQKSYSGYGISSLPRYHACKFSSKTDNISFFDPNLPKNEFWVRVSKM